MRLYAFPGGVCVGPGDSALLHGVHSFLVLVLGPDGRVSMALQPEDSLRALGVDVASAHRRVLGVLGIVRFLGGNA